MKKLPLITVIVPVYNTKEYLPRCVEGIMAQTYGNLEIILVDDGSTDGTGDLCDAYAGKDERIRVFHKANGGSSSARNYGLERATGEYVGFVDSDDYVEPDTYERMMRGIIETGISIAQIGRDEIDEDGNRLPDVCVPPSEEKIYSKEEFMKELLLHKGDCSFCTKLLRRDLFQNNRFPEGRLNEDFYLMIHLLTEVEGVLSLPERGYHVFYRMGSNSRKKDQNDFSRVFEDNVVNADEAAGIVEKWFPTLGEIAFRFGIFQRLDYLLHIPIPMMKRDNSFYREVVRYLRKNWGRAMKNPILTKKNKAYHTAFAIMPKGIRIIHKRLKGI